MKDLEIVAKKWLEKNGIAYTNKLHISLTNLLLNIETDAINRGYNDGLCKPRW